MQDTPGALRPEHVQPGAELEVEIDALAMGGKGVGRAAGLVLFVERGLPGQRLRVCVTRRKKRHAEAEILAVLRQGEGQVEPPCPHFGMCGGCDWQHLDYANQLEWKRAITAESLQRIAGMAKVEVLPTLPSPRQFHYRNKMEFAFAGGGDSLILGLRRRASHDVLPLENCLLPPGEMLEAVHVVRELCTETGVPAWDPLTREGYWRFLVLRCFATPEGDGGDMLAQLITADAPQWRDAALEVLERALSLLAGVGLRGVVHGVRRQVSQVAQAGAVAQVAGEDALEAILRDPRVGDALRYRVSANAFFQINTEAAQELASLIRQWAAVEKGDVVWDVYCGGGGPGLFLARQARLLVGFEISREAVEDARHNAALNELGNCVFRAGDVRRSLARERENPDVVLLDPPRTGLSAEVVAHLLARAPKRIVYVSCDPATQARDVGLLQGYGLAAARPVDLFPQTRHVESVVLLERKA